MIDTQDLIERFDRLKNSLTEQWLDNGITIPPTDKEVWGQMRAVAVQNQFEALADDMQGYVDMYQERIQAIDDILEKIEGLDG